MLKILVTVVLVAIFLIVCFSFAPSMLNWINLILIDAGLAEPHSMIIGIFSLI